MNQWLNKTSKAWVITLALLTCLSVSTGSSSPSVTHSRQTEVSVRSSLIKATHLYTSTFSKKFTHYAGDLCYLTQVATHTQQAVLRQKNSPWKGVVTSYALGHSHLKKPDSKEDTALPKS